MKITTPKESLTVLDGESVVSCRLSPSSKWICPKMLESWNLELGFLKRWILGLPRCGGIHILQNTEITLWPRTWLILCSCWGRSSYGIYRKVPKKGPHVNDSEKKCGNSENGGWFTMENTTKMADLQVPHHPGRGNSLKSGEFPWKNVALVVASYGSTYRYVSSCADICHMQIHMYVYHI